MPKLTKVDPLNNFWQELVSHVSSLTSIDKDVIISLNADNTNYDNIEVLGIEKNDNEIYIKLTSKIKVTLFSKGDYEYYFDNLFDDNSDNTFDIAQSEFLKVFKFYKEIQFKDL